MRLLIAGMLIVTAATVAVACENYGGTAGGGRAGGGQGDFQGTSQNNTVQGGAAEGGWSITLGCILADNQNVTVVCGNGMPAAVVGAASGLAFLPMGRPRRRKSDKKGEFL